ncbi:MAG: ABC-type uncharacterized transport system YnjBCD permease subunit [Pirellulaceae bacterium]|jgi:ABC-type uncharacterized transport system YnjBCD permease subunit
MEQEVIFEFEKVSLTIQLGIANEQRPFHLSSLLSVLSQVLLLIARDLVASFGFNQAD